MAKEYIEREAFKKAFNFEIAPDEWCKGRMANRILDEIPAADVVEVKHGRWVSIADKPHMIYECSSCKDRWGYGSVIHMNYCPNCGCKMDGE